MHRKKLNTEAARRWLVTEHLIPEENMGIGLYERENHALISTGWVWAILDEPGVRMEQALFRMIHRFETGLLIEIPKMKRMAWQRMIADFINSVGDPETRTALERSYALEQKRFALMPLDGWHPFHFCFLTDGLPAAVQEAWERFREEIAGKAIDAWLTENNINLNGISELDFETVPVRRKPKKSKPQHRGKRK